MQEEQEQEREKRNEEKSGKIVAIYGGAFDPPHFGHVSVVQAIRKKLGPEAQILILVSKEKENKRKCQTPAHLRLLLARAAFPDEKDVRLNPFDCTIDLLRSLPSQSYRLVIGADQFRAFFTSWQEPHAILSLCKLLVCPRPGFLLKEEEEEEGVAEILEPDEIEISSSELRNCKNLSCTFIPPHVLSLIELHRLYYS